MPMAIWWVAGFVAILLVLLPRWGYSGKAHNWQHSLGSAVGIILIICLILILLGRV
ncbi:MAG: DUF3309 family protein [Limisphaerales bacterium]